MIIAIFRRTSRSWCLSFLIGLGCISALGQDLSGLWNNGKDGFGEAALSIRKDGKGVLHAAVWKAPFRWGTNSEGIVLKVMVGADPTNHFSMAFTYDRKLGTLIRTNASSEVDVFSRISTNEPPDYEAIAEQKQREQQEAVNKANKEARARITTNRVETASEMFRQAQSFAETQSTNRQPRSLSVRSLDGVWKFSIQGGDIGMVFGVPLLSLSSSNKSSPYPIRRLVEATNPAPNLPVIYRIAEGTCTKLTNFCSSEKIEAKIYTEEEPGKNGVEAFDRTLLVSIYSEQPVPSVTKILRFMLFEVIGTEQRGFEIITK